MAQLIERPFFEPHRCFTCTHAGVEHGPYLDTGYVQPRLEQRVYFCAGCIATFMRPLGYVPEKQLLEALQRIENADVIERQLAESVQTVQKFEAKVAELTALVGAANGEKEALRRKIEEMHAAEKAKRREDLFASVAAAVGSTESKTEGPVAA